MPSAHPTHRYPLSWPGTGCDLPPAGAGPFAWMAVHAATARRLARIIGRAGIVVSAVALGLQSRSADAVDLKARAGQIERAADASPVGSVCSAYLGGEAFAGTFVLPVDRAAELTSRFGMRRHPILGRARMHTGVDWESPGNEAVYAPADGLVVTAGSVPGYGSRIEVDHGNGWRTTYSYLDAILRSPCDVVRSGQEIGRIGATGATTSRHLHFEVLLDGKFVDPEARLLKPAN